MGRCQARTDLRGAGIFLLRPQRSAGIGKKLGGRPFQLGAAEARKPAQNRTAALGRSQNREAFHRYKCHQPITLSITRATAASMWAAARSLRRPQS